MSEQTGQKRSKVIQLPAPVARHGDTVNVLNYRMRPAQWERGTVVAVTYCERWGAGFHLSYDVQVDRPAPESHLRRRRGSGYRISVGPDAIEATR